MDYQNFADLLGDNYVGNWFVCITKNDDLLLCYTFVWMYICG